MTDTIMEIIEKNIDKMFTDVAEEYDLKSGDISRGRIFELSDVKEQLGDILGDYVHHNTPEGENGEEI